MNKNPQKQTSNKQVGFDSRTNPDLFEALCSSSTSEEACQTFVDRLQEASNNIYRDRSK